MLAALCFVVDEQVALGGAPLPRESRATRGCCRARAMGLVSLYDEVRRRREAGDCLGLPELLLPLSEAGDVEAQYLLGSLMFWDCDVEWKELLPWLEAAARQEHPGALFELCQVHEGEDGGLFTGLPDTPERLAMLRRAAELGWREAQRELGCLLCVGEDGWPNDPVEGRIWYRRAAEQGHVDAQYDLGMMLLLGEGGDVDPADGLVWLRRSADADDIRHASYSCGVLAELLESGALGVAQDRDLAEHYRRRKQSLDRLRFEKYGF